MASSFMQLCNGLVEPGSILRCDAGTTTRRGRKRDSVVGATWWRPE